MLKCLLIIVTILFGFNINQWCLCEKGLKKLIRLDKSKIPEMSCNDHLERINLNVTFLNNSLGTIFSLDDKFVIEYSYDKQQCQNKACIYQKLIEFNSTKSSFRLIVNTYYEYKFEIFLINKASKSLNNVNNTNNNTDSINEIDMSYSYKNVCINHLNFVKFKNCQEYEFNIHKNGVCTLNLIKKYDSNNSLIIYVYFFIFISLCITIVLIIAKFFFNKYRRLR